MAIRLTGSSLHIDLDVTSAILNHAGIKGILCYFSLIMYKKKVGDRYVTIEKLKKCSLLESEKDFTTPLIKLQEMGLVVKKGNMYTATTKNKRWLGFVTEHYEDSLTLGGTLVLHMDEFYQLKKCPLKNIEERLYLTINNAVRRGKSLSRGFIQKVTGVSPYRQMKIEEKYEDILQDNLFMPLNAEERDRIDHLPFMKGRIEYESNKVIQKSEKENVCTVVQLGNTMAIHPSLCHGFLKWKKVRKKRESLSLNEPVQKRGEVCDWDSFYATIDLSMEKNDRSKRLVDFLNIKDRRSKTWKYLKKNPYDSINVINKKGNILNLREHLRRYAF